MLDVADRETWDAVDAYFARLLPEDPALAAALDRAAAAGLPPHDVAPNQGRLLQLLALAAGARRILEIGTLAGYSTIWLARAVPPDGEVLSIEVDPAAAEVARANLAAAGAAGLARVLAGAAAEVLPTLDGPFDLVFIDADKQGNPGYLREALRLSRPGTLIVADNVVRGGAVADAGSTDPRVLGVRAFTDLMAAEPRLQATAIQTVGAKGHDGFVLARVR